MRATSPQTYSSSIRSPITAMRAPRNPDRIVSRLSGPITRKLRFDEIADDVDERDVGLLDPRRVARGGDQREIGLLAHLSAGSPTEHEGLRPLVPRAFERAEDVLGVAARGDPDDDIPRPCVSLDLSP